MTGQMTLSERTELLDDTFTRLAPVRGQTLPLPSVSPSARWEPCLPTVSTTRRERAAQLLADVADRSHRRAGFSGQGPSPRPSRRTARWPVQDASFVALLSARTDQGKR